MLATATMVRKYLKPEPTQAAYLERFTFRRVRKRHLRAETPGLGHFDCHGGVLCWLMFVCIPTVDLETTRTE